MAVVAESEKTQRVIVVGMNRTRLLKIMAMVAEEISSRESDGAEEKCEHECVPCVAAMSSYEGNDGEPIRYLSSFVFHDGSSMNQFFDDEGFRSSFEKAIMVGYEWQESDKDLLGKYFEAFQLPTEVAIECVCPNPGFSSLGEEMRHYKTLTPLEKEDHTMNHTMGPGKMKRFIIDALKQLSKPVDSSNESELDAATATTKPENYDNEQPCLSEEAENDAGSAEVPEEEEKKVEESPEQRMPNFIDQNITAFACRMCRSVLLDENHLTEYTQNQHSFLHKRGHKTTNRGSSSSSRCQSLFCDESVLEWLAPKDAVYDVQGILTCPRCSCKIGHWNWSGAQCSCGTWVVPAIQIPLGKVDIILPLSERQKASPMVIVGPKIL